ncbi:hypothetical protein H2200_012890 [Cladophialophora chaetospira]|uniref:AB hydrolase-1 domain-containing protein n=1 Tax=Cladophialophora chaetospira TaxID=386627 RepID=A0AA38WWZ4_9EURO|nr:hypothetical protein H2200_012890 [Cladophialophora chaetospira]
MRSSIISAAALLATCTSAAPVVERTADAQANFPGILASYSAGFKNPTIQSSAGGQAICISGFVDITASANNFLLNTEIPANQSAVTQLVTELMQVNSTKSKSLNGGPNHVSGTYSIYSQLCFPQAAGTIDATTLQFLIHGSGLDRSYWNAAPGYSYVDYAAEQGYTTFLYDRLGTGLSDHPDPVQVVQLNLQVVIAHELIQLLRTGGFANQTFKRVVGVGHSYGSAQTASITAQYPKDFDAIVLTGWSADNSGMPVAFAGLDLAIANQVAPRRLAALNNGYLTSAGIEGTQFFFFREPQFDPLLLDLAEATKQTLSLGELLTNIPPKVSTNFTGPIIVVNGENDLPNCAGNCLVPYNKPAAVKAAFYPNASNGSSWYLAPSTGHGLTFHYTADAAYAHIHDFLKKNGF